MTDASRRTRTGVLSIVLAYASVSGLWILLSDRAIGTLFHDPESLVQASMVKGWFFVAVTTLLLYVLVRRFARVLLASQEHEIALELERKQPPPMLVAIADASSDAIFAKDEQGRYLLFNNAAARFVGKPASEVVGDPTVTPGLPTCPFCLFVRERLFLHDLARALAGFLATRGDVE